MKPHESAAQIWPILVGAAKNEQPLSYGDVARRIGEEDPRIIGQLLEPIQSYCLLNKLPALTVLVVNKNTGEPGRGFIAVPRDAIPNEKQKVFNHNWMAEKTPSPDDLQAAVKKLPSCGRPEAAQYNKT